MRYETRLTHERFGLVELRVFALESLDRTIDQLFEELSRTGDERLLEDLCPYFGQVWPAARGLVAWIGERSLDWAGSRVLEVGCGLALPSLALAQNGARVVATDFHPDVPAFLEKNQALNGVRVAYRVLDWRTGGLEESFDWIIGSDILYEKQHPRDVAQALDRLAGRSARIAIGDPGRPYLQGFVSEMERLGWKMRMQTYSVLDSRDPAGPSSTRDVFVLLFDSEGR